MKLAQFILLFLPFLTWSQVSFNQVQDIPVYEGARQLNMPWVGGLNNPQFSAIELNFDGHLDLVAFDRGVHGFKTFIWNASTSLYEYAPEYESSFPEIIRWVLLRDYNCDGLNDLFGYTLGGVQLWRNTSTGGVLSFELVDERIQTDIDGAMSSLYVSPVDVPGIEDIDGDGDLDFFTYEQAPTVRYHKNMSMETYGVCDSVVYELKNACWGLFSEEGTDNQVVLYDTLNYYCRYPDLPNPERPESNGGNGGDRHSGGGILPIDLNADGVYDLLIGEITSPHINKLINGGTAPNQNSPMISQDLNFPVANQVDVPIFPVPYYVDVDHDGIRDLLVSTNTSIDSDLEENIWYYRNSGADNNPSFNLETSGFLQEDMFDVGEYSNARFIDYNGDGLLDIVVGNLRSYNKNDGTYFPSLALYINTGSASTPEYTLENDDFLSVSSMYPILSFNVVSGDLRNVDVEDLVVGASDGKLRYYENQATPGQAGSYALIGFLEDDQGAEITVPNYSAPYLYDLDNDGDLDLIIGKGNGQLTYYENTGTVSSYSFTYRTDSWGGVDVSEYWDATGYSFPTILEKGTEIDLIVGGKNGTLSYYENLWKPEFDLIDSAYMGNLGSRLTVDIADLDGDLRPEMMIGDILGGLRLWRTQTVLSTNSYETIIDVAIFPNPSTNVFTVQGEGVEIIEVKVMDLQGRLVLSTINTTVEHNLKKGVYIVQVETSKGSKSIKLVIE